MKRKLTPGFHFATLLLATSAVISSCGQPNADVQKTENKEVTAEAEVKPEVVYNTNSTESMLRSVAQACGGMDQLRALQDVQFEYHYLKPDGKRDISQERYIFDQEVSWARYSVHEENVSPDLTGDIVQFYDGKQASAFNNGEPLSDPKAVGTSEFLRRANFMWFSMMFKFCDPGTVQEYIGQEDMDGKTYDVVTVTYDPAVTGKEMNDTYILYINPESHLVEHFKFSLPAFGVEQPVLLAKLEYQQIDGIQVVVRRQMFGPNPETGELAPMVDQQLKDVRFKNGFTAENLSKEV